MPKIVFYVSSHGFGHATRAIELISNLPELIGVEVVTTAPRWLFYRSLKRAFTYHDYLHDCGVMQIDSLQQDIKGTFERWNDLLDHYPEMAEEEAQRLEKIGADLVIGDISPFAVAVAEAAELPSLIVANFSWNWIFTAFLTYEPRFQEIIDRIADYYARTTLLLKTPLSGDLSVFPDAKDIPLIARRSKKTRSQARKALGLPLDGRVVLITFGGCGLNRIKKEQLAARSDINFLTFNRELAGPPNIWILDPERIYHPDAVRASNLVLAKLGYGIVSECIAHETPIAYIPLSNFPEQGVFESELPKYLSSYKIQDDIFHDGQWDFLDVAFEAAASQTQPHERLALNGGEVATDILCDLLR
ncbi:MAG: hypothetical protein AB1656_12110 [Candidatus Omnitrophota bacterium]